MQNLSPHQPKAIAQLLAEANIEAAVTPLSKRAHRQTLTRAPASRAGFML